MKKYKVKIKEVIVHEFEVEEFNPYMAEQKARQLLERKQKDRMTRDDKDIEIEKVS